MKKTLQKGIAQLVILGIMGLLAIVLPVATKLVQENQENRSQAALTMEADGGGGGGSVSTCSSSKCGNCITSSSCYGATGCTWAGGACMKKVVTPPTATPKPECSSGQMICRSGNVYYCSAAKVFVKDSKDCGGRGCVEASDTYAYCKPAPTNTPTPKPECSSGQMICRSGNVYSCSTAKVFAFNKDCKGFGCVEGSDTYAYCKTAPAPECTTAKNPTKCLNGTKTWCWNEKIQTEYCTYGCQGTDCAKCDTRGGCTSSQVCQNGVCVAKPSCTTEGGFCMTSVQCSAISGTGISGTSGCDTSGGTCCNRKTAPCSKNNDKCIDSGRTLYYCDTASGTMKEKFCGSNENGTGGCGYDEVSKSFLCKLTQKVDGRCSTKPYECLAGNKIDKPSETGYIVWACEGWGGGKTDPCALLEPGATTKSGVCTTKGIKNACDYGVSFDLSDTATEYRWYCLGNNNNSTSDDVVCKLAIPNVNKICSSSKLVGSDLAWGLSACGVNADNKKNLYTCGLIDGKLTSKTCSYKCENGKCISGSNPPVIPPVDPTVIPPANLTGIVLSPNPLNLTVGEKKNVNVETIPSGLTASYRWKSGDANVATVDINGMVTGKNLGEASITAGVDGTNIESSVKAIVEGGSVTQCTDYNYSLWGECTNGNQTRVVEGNIPEGCSGQPGFEPTLSQSCGDESDASVSFKIAFAGIAVGNSCVPTYLIPETKLNLDIGNIPSNKHEDRIQTSFEATNETDSKGNQIFKVTSLTLDKSKFGTSNTFNYIKVKGPWHLKRRMCQDGQSGKLDESTVCNIDLRASNTHVYDFSEYTLLAGDIFTDGVVNSLDLAYIKLRLDPGKQITCGIEGDMNMDGVVNTFDFNLAKDTLTERDDE